MAIIPYTGDTTQLADRFPPVAPTEHLSQASAPTAPLVLPTPAPWGIAVLLLVAVALVLGACWLVVRVNNEAFSVLAAVLVAGFIKIAFGPEER